MCSDESGQDGRGCGPAGGAGLWVAGGMVITWQPVTAGRPGGRGPAGSGAIGRGEMPAGAPAG